MHSGLWRAYSPLFPLSLPLPLPPLIIYILCRPPSLIRSLSDLVSPLLILFKKRTNTKKLISPPLPPPLPLPPPSSLSPSLQQTHLFLSSVPSITFCLLSPPSLQYALVFSALKSIGPHRYFYFFVPNIAIAFLMLRTSRPVDYAPLRAKLLQTSLPISTRQNKK